jgi:hypothetical protein
MPLFIIGLLITFGAVGGIEQADNNIDMLVSALFAVPGLLTMYLGVNTFKNQ